MISRQISKLIKNEIQLPTLPAVAAEILQAVNNDDAALAELGRIIAVDPALSAKMLRVANSGLFTCHREVTDLKRAMSVLGTNTIKSIALSFVISADLCGKQDAGVCYDDFWRRAVTTAVSAELLAKRLALPNSDIFLTALLQDLGVLVLLLGKGDEYKRLLDSELDSFSDLSCLEKECYGFDHQQVAGFLFEQWKLPEALSVPILYHHQPDAAPDDYCDTAQILYLSDLLAGIYTSQASAEKARLLQERLAVQYGLGDDAVAELIDEVAEKSREIIALFDIDPQAIQPYSQLLQHANAELEKLNLSAVQLILELQESKEQNQRLIQKLQDANGRLKELVHQDGLTGLYNHRYFQEALDNELARATRYRSSVSLVLFDLDNFKQANDTHGYLVGDMVLMNIARAVNGAVRSNDVVARFGGDEFAIILPATNGEGAKAFAEHLRSCIEGIATMVEKQWVNVTISVGTASAVPGEAVTSRDQLIAAADRALCLSKDRGRNQVNCTDLKTG